ncbi:regulatory protein [Mariprofundus ferrinatatus]|uniref:Regulatory protein RecX n=2 Tax=Mariprofundus ferrinatatus TaxID=1921087 RepID=A0A2K8L668_9PROT|nr:regulatory protein RecX [Mariprofundus ferrinatatus]ATX81749.1 regulatory protein [Mariprofundus ferrinatatus]
MRSRLSQRGFEQELVAFVLEQLKQEGYLSEKRYAESYLRSRLNRGEAPWLAAQKAKQKGVDHTVLEAVLADMNEDFDAQEACRTLLEHRDPGGLRFEDERVWQRQARFLRNKGYNSATILRVLKQR